MLTILREGLRIVSRSVRVKFKGFKKYSGNDEEISTQIVNDCYNSKIDYFQASSGNYPVFYSRDFGWCVESLISLGYSDKVEKTLEYVLNIYSKRNTLTVGINDLGKPYNFPNVYSPDSALYLFRSLRIAKSKRLIFKYKKFLNIQLAIFKRTVLTENGMLQDKQFSGMRDHIKARRVCYDMIMACALCDEVDKINKLMGKVVIENTLKAFNLKEILIKNYWNGKYFIDSKEDPFCSGSANVYAYFLDVITDVEMLKSSIKSLREQRSDKPLPLQYGYSDKTKFIWIDMFSHDWEKHTSWAMLGLAYIEVVSKVDLKLAKTYLSEYEKMINKYKCFIELYSGTKPYQSLFFAADDSMLWASMYLDLKKKLK